jgi:hypothetical protein
MALRRPGSKIRPEANTMVQSPGGGAVARSSPGGGALGEVLDRILDKGIVIDAWASVSLLGIEIVSVQAQVVVASVETYLKYAREVSSLAAAAQIEEQPKNALPSEEELVGYLEENIGGLRLEQLVEHFHAPRELVESVVNHLISEHKARSDAERGLLLPAKG